MWSEARPCGHGGGGVRHPKAVSPPGLSLLGHLHQAVSGSTRWEGKCCFVQPPLPIIIGTKALGEQGFGDCDPGRERPWLP